VHTEDPPRRPLIDRASPARWVVVTEIALVAVPLIFFVIGLFVPK
jgi:hypothetical protein